MPRYKVALEVEIEAESAEAAFAYVRSYATITDEYAAQHGTQSQFEFYVLPPEELAEGELVIQ